MGAAFLITLREGIEAALVVSIILAYLNAIGHRERRGTVWWGVVGAVAVSLVAGVVLNATVGAISETSERTAEIIEGIGSVLAVIVLTWMIFWMRRQARHIKGELQGRVDVALASGSNLALAALAFFVVVREGLETVLFLFGTIREEVVGSTALAYVGAALGLAVAVLLGVLIYRGGIRLNLRTFFRVTGALILVVAAGLLAYGIHEFQEVGWLPGADAHAFDISGVLSDEGGVGALLRAMFGYNADPTWLELTAWAGYLLVTGFLFFRPDRTAPAPAARAEGAPASRETTRS
ncbi:MAG TPA: iron uptake transporter permease EfeU [Actinomycetota bacterium]|nr:iron uptake transporter permease EfeU [Actinomycetota bacterium]